jgi:7-cyano-7-deazaguanine reductase
MVEGEGRRFPFVGLEALTPEVLKSLKYYLTSFRSVGIYQEHAAHRILDDLVACCAPRWMEVVLDYRLRGGIHTVVTVSHGRR